MSLAPDSERIGALNEGLRSLQKGRERRERRLGWLAGLGIDDRTVRDGWRRAASQLSDFVGKARRAILDDVTESPLVVTGSCHAALMFGSVAPDIRESDALGLAQVMVDLYSSEGDPEVMEEICRATPVEDYAPHAWLQGYELAEDLHERFQEEFLEDESVAIERMIETLGIRIEERELSDDTIRGVAIAGPKHQPGIVVNTSHPANMHSSGRRFTLAHELCHLLFDRETGRRLAVASGPWAPRDVERRANAFAAMLLMPASLVSRVAADLNEPLCTREGVREVAARLRAGRPAVLHHLKNLGFIDETDLQRIEDQASRYGWSDRMTEAPPSNP